jgi:glutamine amidotransferase-like protein
MADLLAIIASDRSKRVDGAPLSAAYESLRGGATFSAEASCGWAAVQVLDHPHPPTAGVLHGDGGWTAWAGPLADPASADSAPLDRLDGQFALIRLDPDGTTLRVATDPLGMKPLFVATSHGESYFSTSALALAKHLRCAPSALGLQAFLRTGNQFGRLTPWEGIERLAPGEAITFTPGGSERAAYWRPGVDPEVRRLSFDACAVTCTERAVEAIAQRYGGARPWLDLTGGFDTRLLALLAHRAGLQFLANTSGEEDNEDVRLARQIAAEAGWPWTQFTLPPNWGERLAAGVDAAVAWGDGHLDALPLTEVMQGHRSKAEVESLLFNGGGGEHFRDYPWGQELWAAGRSTTVNFERLLAWRVLGPIDLGLFRTDPTPAVAAALQAELEARVEPFAGAPNTFQCDLLYAFKATGHFGAYQSTAGAWEHMELPFYLKPVFTTAISSSPRHRNLHRLMREMMRLLDPTIAAIQTETGGPAEPLRIGNLHRFAPYPWRRGRRFASRLRGRILPSSAATTQPSVLESARGELVGRLRAEGRLDPVQMRSAALYDPVRLEQLLAVAATDPGAADWGLVGRVITSELALEATDAGLG